ncbi:uncharacterized protein LACBIDRAFT_334260 [Laccaria bicolor S238N-H82]|uniref:Predicted protein n=1 Tax=Laccaria bicolor (strain S238N-H82 / ATCC MYA-4686) TaxID=486041 RepID=B0DYN1_LACBS|nr:uncharacterized protein LACBIDRAFT_334260 [Laccaria bicolor S238N-H82]EDR00320.1 predicted protein [Laccaria bicolor S238N-H82]|eukprot:XP_001889072.1 predicted protein [Laccaria bicolor S238N-H82]
MARRELGKYKQANEDLDLFINGGGDRLLAAQARELLSKYPVEDINLSPSTTPDPTDHLANEVHAIGLKEGDPFTIRESNTQRGCCALATKKIRRGDLILSEKPVVIVGTGKPQLAIQAELRGLSPTHLNSFLHLSNGHADCSCFLAGQRAIGIYSTNSFALTDDQGGIGLTASRFNHSCSPNARFSFNPTNGQLRIFALSDIPVGEEICVAYLSSRRLYGQTRQHRQGILRSRYHFTCSCSVCSLPKAEMILSDSRRVKVNELWDKVPMFPPNQTIQRLNTIVQAINLLEEEGYAADYDDFTNDAALICAYHSDYESSKYWAKLTYETRVAEFGEDSPRAAEADSGLVRRKEF